MIDKQNNNKDSNNNTLIVENNTESIIPTEKQTNMMEIDNYFIKPYLNVYINDELKQQMEETSNMIESDLNTLLKDSDDFNDNILIRRTNSYSDLYQKSSLSESVWDMEINNFKENNPQSFIQINYKNIYNKLIETARISTSQINNLTDSFEGCTCFCCKNYFTIHDKNISDYLSKYNLKNKLLIPRSSKNFKRLYMLRPDIFAYRSLEDYRYLNNINLTSIVTEESYEFKYEIWMWNDGYPESIVNCTLCEKEFCSIHLEYNPFLFTSCGCCSKKWSICSWCLFENFKDYIVGSKYVAGLKLLDEDIFCEILHSK